ncbi:putative transposase [Oscillibacter valericigenes Sjm18-20]|nr:putative transposase [Oscillibacter valericigenes Sjm18-20]
MSSASSSCATAIIERYRRRESSVEEALVEMYLAGAFPYVV